VSAVPELVSTVGVRKSYGRVEALAGVDFAVRRAEIVGLVGDNGAGKSTLVKVLSGAVRPDAGEIRVRGELVNFKTTADAIDAGIETIYQGSALVEELSVARNLFLGREPTKRVALVPRLDWRTIRDESRALLRRMGLEQNVDPDERVEVLSGGERQSIAIARAMFFEAELIILDEPTNNLGVEETRRVLEFMREAKASGRASIFITHNIFHIFQVVDRIVVLRRGRKVVELKREETDLEEVERHITGTGLAQVEA
jgi:simple sugar transport system ATP-binding protein